MASSGVTNFGFETEAIDVIKEAFERMGKGSEELSQVQVVSAVNSLQYLFSDWENDQVNLWTIQTVYIPLVVGQAGYTLARGIITPLQIATRQSSGSTYTDLMIQPISESEYLALPNKAQASARPTSFMFSRTETPVLNVWPVLQTGFTCTLVCRMIRSLYDVGDTTNTLDVPNRWMDAMAAGLAYRLATKYAPERKADLQADYMSAYARAKAEDRERVPLRIFPDAQGPGWGYGQ